MEKGESWIRTDGTDVDIEKLIIPRCVELHRQRMKNEQSTRDD
jgi:hypothetical protein